MSNETANRSHAGLVIQMFLDAANNPPKLLASWGFIDASLAPVAGQPGAYSIRLVNAASGLIGPTPILFESVDSVVLSSSLVESPVVFVRAALFPDPALPAPAVGDRAQLPIVGIALTDVLGVLVDGDAVLNLEVRAVPQQD